MSSSAPPRDEILLAFQKFDLNVDGRISKKEFLKALQRPGGGDPLSDTEAAALFSTMDKDGDGSIDPEEFASTYGEVQRWVPLAVGDPALKDAFIAFCSFGKAGSEELDNAKFAKLCKEARLLDKRFTKTDVDLTFSKVCPKGQRKLGFAQFESALSAIAAKKGVPVGEVHAAVAAASPVNHGTKASNDAVVAHFTDASKYTGAHKERFDADGRGKGLAGRDSVPKGQGHVPAGGLASLADRSPADIRGVKY